MLRITRTLPRNSIRSFSTAEAAGVKVSSLDDSRPVSQVSLVVKAGSRYQSVPGTAHLLEKFFYQNTAPRSGLRLVRESELLGGQLSSKVERENIVLTTSFLREDLPYFVQALADIASETRFEKYELDEEAGPRAILEAQLKSSDAVFTATEAVHAVSFKRGLGNALLVQQYSPVGLETVKNYAREAYTKSNVSVVARGVVHDDLVSLVSDKFAKLPAGSVLSSPKSVFSGGEARIPASVGNAVVLAFPVESEANAQVLAHLLGGEQPSVKWNIGTSPFAIAGAKTGASINAKVLSYSDAQLLTVTVSGESASVVSEGVTAAVSALKGVASATSKEAITRAIAQAKFARINATETDVIKAVFAKELELSKVSEANIKSAVSSLISGKKSLAVVGQVHELPYLDELF
jgi:ubiquinol-cytochrome c reductase core subunit 2